MPYNPTPVMHCLLEAFLQLGFMSLSLNAILKYALWTKHKNTFQM